jgi:hypothetical protein
MKMPVSKRICELNDFGDSIFYKLICECGGDDCDTDLELSKDEEFGFITLNFYSKLSRYCDSFLDRFKCALKILFTGNLTLYGNTLMSEDQIDDFIMALQEAKEKVVNYED